MHQHLITGRGSTGQQIVNLRNFMDKHYYDKIFSTERMRKYFEKYPNEESKAIEHYHLNIELSESFYPLLSIFEVALRNSLNRELITFFGTSDWYLKMVATTGLKT